MTLTVRLGDLALRNPVCLASGTCGFGRELDDLLPLHELGGLFSKAVTPEPRAGNSMPRLAETEHGLLNSIGLANPGLEAFCRDKLHYLRGLDTAVFVNVAGRTAEDYLTVCRRLQELEDEAGPTAGALAGIELNVSCPNVKEGGISFGARPGPLGELVARVRAVWRGRLLVKLTPQTADVAEQARAAEAAGADGLSLINTIPGMSIDLRTRRPRTVTNTSGYSGPAIRPVAVAQVYQAARAVRLPVVGMGGIQSGCDVAEFLLAGASAVQVGTASFAQPDAARRILAEFEAWLEREGVATAAELVGAVRPW
ncbi:MAG: dihydroorotate dehydrogenase [Candidatus Delongbacteria bacterium]